MPLQGSNTKGKIILECLLYFNNKINYERKSMSFTTVLFPILAALSGAEQFMQLSPNWVAVNPIQENFLAYLPNKDEQLSKLSGEELKTIASFDYKVINKFLADHKFDKQLEPFNSPGEFGVASILNVLIEWIHEGKTTTIMHNNQEFPAVSMTGNDFEVLQSNAYKEPILKLTAKNGDIVYMTIAEKSLESFELLEFVQTLLKMPKNEITKQYVEAIFPMVNLNHETDISWLIGLGTSRLRDNCFFNIAQAKQQTKFQMNEKGAHVQSAVAISIKEMCYIEPKPLKTLVINKPFYLWIERPGANMPIFTSYIDPIDWKKPDTITD